MRFEAGAEASRKRLGTVACVKQEIVLGNLVVGCIQTRDHPMMEEREEALAEMSLVLEDIVRKRLGEALGNPSLDGLKTLLVESDGETTLHIVGAFYVIVTRPGGGTDLRMLPVEAHLSVKDGALSTVKVGGQDSAFEMPQSARQFARGVEAARWRHRLDLRLN